MFKKIDYMLVGDADMASEIVEASEGLKTYGGWPTSHMHKTDEQLDGAGVGIEKLVP